MLLTFRLVTGESHTIEVDPSQTIEDLKNVISSMINSPIEKTKILYRAKVLKNEQTIASINYTQDTFLVVHKIVVRKVVIPKSECPSQEAPPPQNSGSGNISVPPQLIPPEFQHSPDFQRNLEILIEMGLAKREFCEKALRLAKNNVESAADLLLTDPSFTSPSSDSPNQDSFPQTNDSNTQQQQQQQPNAQQNYSIPNIQPPPQQQQQQTNTQPQNYPPQSQNYHSSQQNSQVPNYPNPNPQQQQNHIQQDYMQQYPSLNQNTAQNQFRGQNSQQQSLPPKLNLQFGEYQPHYDQLTIQEKMVVANILQKYDDPELVIQAYTFICDKNEAATLKFLKDTLS
ncbi:hypothetical protein TRFO_01246 [Tritrichomonas foetus]|uniref:UBA domain-containing protein n=1 Tax=Tritrichomonas foetus TaxID=1144522 RepID=A0A1J4KCF7_9EUKA|nr:hypothetical protein TRFO_01246 [Tritrichomonas foetus]|eukprot:OHT07141.1 hypothetical protein TRFO_01246 [Tritrichomonas foetus]